MFVLTSTAPLVDVASPGGWTMSNSLALLAVLVSLGAAVFSWHGGRVSRQVTVQLQDMTRRQGDLAEVARALQAWYFEINEVRFFNTHLSLRTQLSRINQTGTALLMAMDRAGEHDRALKECRDQLEALHAQIGQDMEKVIKHETAGKFDAGWDMDPAWARLGRETLPEAVGLVQQVREALRVVVV